VRVISKRGLWLRAAKYADAHGTSCLAYYGFRGKLDIVR